MTDDGDPKRTKELDVSEVDGHAAFRLPGTLRLALPGSNRLRRDSQEVIYYGNALFDTWIFRLIPAQVVSTLPSGTALSSS